MRKTSCPTIELGYNGGHLTSDLVRKCLLEFVKKLKKFERSAKCLPWLRKQKQKNFQRCENFFQTFQVLNIMDTLGLLDLYALFNLLGLISFAKLGLFGQLGQHGQLGQLG